MRKRNYDELGNSIAKVNDDGSSKAYTREWLELWDSSVSLYQSIILGLGTEFQHRFGQDFPKLRVLEHDPLGRNPHAFHDWALIPRSYRDLKVVLLEYTVTREEPVLDYLREDYGSDFQEIFSVTRTLQFPIVFFHALAKRDSVAIDQFGELVVSAYRCDLAMSKLEFLFHTDVQLIHGMWGKFDREHRAIERKCDKEGIISAVSDIAGSGSRIVAFRGRPLNAKSFALDVAFAVSREASIRKFQSDSVAPWLRVDLTHFDPSEWKFEDVFCVSTALRFDRVDGAESRLENLFELARDFAALLMGAAANGSLTFWSSESGDYCESCHGRGSDCWCGSFPGDSAVARFSNPVTEYSNPRFVEIEDEDIPF